MTRAALAGLLATLAILAFAAPASAQQPSGKCDLAGTQGTKQVYDCRYGPITVAPFQVLTKQIQLGMPTPGVDGTSRTWRRTSSTPAGARSRSAG